MNALEVFTRRELPPDWAMTQNNLGAALQELGTRTGGEEGRAYLNQAIAAYDSALEVFTAEHSPYPHDLAQRNKAKAVQALAEMQDR